MGWLGLAIWRFNILAGCVMTALGFILLSSWKGKASQLKSLLFRTHLMCSQAFGFICCKYLKVLICQPLLSDVPSNVKIDSFGPAADGVALHHEDVIALCKRYCSDQELCQDQFSKSNVCDLQECIEEKPRHFSKSLFDMDWCLIM